MFVTHCRAAKRPRAAQAACAQLEQRPLRTMAFRRTNVDFFASIFVSFFYVVRHVSLADSFGRTHC
jgi:hypothetical protein